MFRYAHENEHPANAPSWSQHPSWIPAFAGMTGIVFQGERLKQEVALRHRQDIGGFAGEEFAVGADFVGFGIDFDGGEVVVELHVALGELADVGDGEDLAFEAQLVGDAVLDRRLGDEGEGGGVDGVAVAGEHGTHVDGLGGGDAGVRVAHLCPGN